MNRTRHYFKEIEMKSNSDTRFEAWQIQEQDFLRQESPADKLNFLIRYAILAPSGHNSQPWKFSVGEDEIQVFADKTRWLRVGDPNQVNLHIAVGCALENLLIAAEHFDYGHQITYFPRPNQEELVATVKFMPQGLTQQSPRPKGAGSGAKGQPSPFRDLALFRAIPNRHTNRKTYEKRPIPESDLRRLQNCCVEEGIRLHVTDNPDTKRNVNELLIRGHTTLIADPAFRRESAYWLGQGLFNLPRLFTRLMQWVMPYLKVNRSVFAVMDTRLVMSAPALAILSASVNDRISQVRVGQVFERVCLTATMLGLCVQPLSGAVDVPELKAQVAKLLSNSDVISQHVFRLGYAEPVKSPASRRPFEEVLV
jgi:nitroreductase